MKAVCLDKDKEGIQLDEYLEKIHDNLYLIVANFCGEYLIDIRKYCLKDGCLKPKTECVYRQPVFTVNQFAIFLEILHDLEERYWALEEGMPVVEYENFVRPWFTRAFIPSGLYFGCQSCRTSRQRLGVNRIDSCNFELCSQGRL